MERTSKKQTGWLLRVLVIGLLMWLGWARASSIRIVSPRRVVRDNFFFIGEPHFHWLVLWPGGGVRANTVRPYELERVEGLMISYPNDCTKITQYRQLLHHVVRIGANRLINLSDPAANNRLTIGRYGIERQPQPGRHHGWTREAGCSAASTLK